MTKQTEKTSPKKTAKATALEQIDFSTPEPEEVPAAVWPAPASPPDPYVTRAINNPIDEDIEPSILLSVRGCSSCGGDHDGVILLPLTSPALDLTHTHFFNCPTTGERVTIQHLAG